MIRFWYRSVGPAGEVVEGMLDAPSKAALIEQLQDQGHVPIRAEEAGAAGARSAARADKNGLFGRPALPRRRLALLTRELATLLHAGLPLDRALEMMADMAEGAAERECLASLIDSVSSGRQLGDAMAPLERDFPPLCVSMVRAGEAAGAVPAGLLRLSECLERAEQTREHVRSALAYPAMVLAVCGISVAILFLFVVPRFRPLFEQAGANLPLATRGVLAVSDLLRSWWWLVLLASAGLLIGLRIRLRNPAVRLRWDRRLLGWPLIGDLAIKIDVARFARTLGTLLRGGITLLPALTMTREAVANRALSAALEEVVASAGEGRGLAEPLARTGYFPALALNLIRVGEETAKHEEMLFKLAEIYDEEARRSIDRLLALVGRAITIALGVLVAGVIGSILAAVLSVYDLAM
jgi:general secretion pathway protein F